MRGSIEQAACCSVQFHCYMQFTHQVDSSIYFMPTVLIRSLCVYYVIINCKCYDIICSAATGSVTRQCHSDLQCGRTSSCYFKAEISEFKIFFQPMDHMSLCFDHTNSKVIKDFLPALRPQISEAFCGFAGRLFGR
jgi:hypothetical protein